MIEDLYNLTMSTTRPTAVADGQGGWTQTQVPWLSGVACATRIASEREAQFAARLEESITDIVDCRPGTDVRRGDRVTVSNGVNGRVVGVEDPAGRGHHLVVHLDRRV